MSTINLYEFNPGLTPETLRMYDVRRDALVRVAEAATGKAYAEDDFADDTDADKNICYLDSTHDGAEPRLIAVPGLSPRTVQATGIPNHRDAIDWYFTQVVYGSSGQLNYDIADPCFDATEVQMTSDQQGASTRRQNMKGTFQVNYKDPCVLKLSDDRWLMLLTRVRSCAVGAGSPPVAFPRGPDELSDIVAYLAPDPSFTTGLAGPFWMCVNIGSLGPGSEGVRFWLSVAGGAMIDEDTLAVHFVAEWTEAAMGVCGTEAEIDAVATSLKWLDRQSANRFVQTLGVKLIPIAGFDVMAAKAGYDDESDWANSANGGTFQMPGDESPVYIWRHEADGVPREEAVDAYPYHKLVDPQCARCELTSDNYAPSEVRLFTAAFPRHDPPEEPNDAWIQNLVTVGATADGGLRISKPVAAGPTVTRRDGATEGMRAGIDFMFIEASPFELMAVDYDSASRTATIINPVDPDPVLMIDRSWRVDFGLVTSQDVGAARQPEITTLQEDRSSDHEDVCGDGGAADPALAAEVDIDFAVPRRQPFLLDAWRPLRGPQKA